MCPTEGSDTVFQQLLSLKATRWNWWTSVRHVGKKEDDVCVQPWPHRWGFLSLEVLSQLGKIFSISQPSLAVLLMHPFFLILKSVSVRHKRQNMFCPHCVWEIFFFQYSKFNIFLIPLLHFTTDPYLQEPMQKQSISFPFLYPYLSRCLLVTTPLIMLTVRLSVSDPACCWSPSLTLPYHKTLLELCL